MARPTTKKDLLNSASEKFNQLFEMINFLNLEEREQNFNFDISKEKEAHWKRDKNIKDVLVHLYEWHQLLINWVNCNMKGIEKQFLIETYNWKTYGEMNIMFWEKHKNTTYQESESLIKKSHEEVLNLIEKFTNEELFEKNKFKWTGGSTLGQYCASATASHYDWAIKKVKKHIKSLK